MPGEDTIERDEIVRLMSLSDDTLLAELGSSAHAAFPQDALRRGRQVLARLRDASREAICGNARIKQIAQDGDKVALAGAIADLLATQFAVAPAATVSVLLVRSGVTDYCSAYWSPEAGDGIDRR
ncbi:hypothetical protein AB0K34_37130 [Actinomadura sp. NPDC049382]|uniref:hypothetical protein n=1 Tax=Actinomadura sp. NPDC049382 TaxID=3158220 RepID=UPI00342CC800